MSAKYSGPKRNRSKTILFYILLLAVALAILAMRPRRTVPISAIDQVEETLLQEGFKAEGTMMFKDEMVLGPANPVKTWVLSRMFSGSYQTMGANRRYVKDGSSLGINYGIVNEMALNVSVPADPVLTARAGEIAATLREMNPRLSVNVRTNETSKAVR